MRYKPVNLRTQLKGKTCIITISNIGLLDSHLPYCVEIVRRFTHADTFFFGFFRTDGIYLDDQKMEEYAQEIPDYFHHNGRYREFPLLVNKRKNLYESLIKVASAPVGEELYTLLPHMFRYYLTTVFFSPKVEWDDFSQRFSHFVKQGTKGFIEEGYADMLFVYEDSEHFAVEFHTDVYDMNDVYWEIVRILQCRDLMHERTSLQDM